ncbi:MAG: ABC transporter substrate-binding protein [Chloroflexi bacterium]|nr:ABC transporter substrate-binding protein [Chloroflexota bacterium]
MFETDRSPSVRALPALSRRSALALLMSATGASLLAACGPSAAPPAPPAATTPPQAPAGAATTAAAPTTAAAAPTAAAPAATTVAATPVGATSSAPAPTATPNPQVKTGGTVRWGQVGDLVTIDAILWSPVSNNTLGQVNEMLIDYDDDLSIMPRLAESWEQSTDNTQIKLNLRQGVQFHTGREFTSDDVEYNLLRARDPKNPYAAVVAVGSAWWTSWEKPDKYTIILKSDQPRPGVFDFLQYLRILDKDTMEGPDATTKVVGTGAFKFVEWAPGDHFTIVKNPNYWESGHPYVDGVNVSIFRDTQAMVVAYESGALDVADLVAIPDADRLRSDGKSKLYQTHDLGQFFYATVNCGMPPMDNKLFRQGINYAIDRQRFTDSIMKGFTGEPRALPWAKSSPAFDAEKNKAYAYDLDKAKSLIAQSGVTNATFDIAWAQAGYASEYQQLATIIQGDLASIGVTTNLKPTDAAAFTQQGLGQHPPYNGMRLSAGAFCQLREAGSEFALSRTFGYANNGAGFYDDQWTQLAAGVATEPDPAKRKQMYDQINDYLLDQSFVMTITPYPDIDALQPNVMDLKYFLSTATNDRNMWLA